MLLEEHCRRTGLAMSVKEAGDGRYVWVNEAMAQLFGRPPGQLIGQADVALMASAQAGLLRAADQAALAAPRPMVTDHRLELPSGRRELSVMRLATDAVGPGLRWVVALWTDLGVQRQREAQMNAALAQIEQQHSELVAMRRELDDPDYRDMATGLHRGTHFDDMLRRELDLSAREHREFALVIVALDLLRAPVEAAAASREPAEPFLEALGAQLKRNTRAMDSSCRLAADRFALVLSGVGLATAHARMESLRRQCAAHIVASRGTECHYTVSMGVASYPHTADNLAGLTEAANRALSESVRRGGNHVALASISFQEK
jgi:diguanylate cyclase (GGDEF)-like protein